MKVQPTGRDERRDLVTMVEAVLTRDTELVGQMDPYIVIMIGDKKWKTTIKDNAGTHPMWNESFAVDLKHFKKEKIMSILVLDDDVGEDDQVGSGEANYGAFADHYVNSWVEIYYNNRSAGLVHLTA